MYDGAKREDYKRDYEGDKRIDMFKLDDECAEVPALIDYWIRLEKIAASRVDELETELAALKSLVELEIKGMDIDEINRKYHLELSEGDRITDKMATNIRRQDSRVKEIISTLNAAKFDYKISYAARTTMVTKKEMLDNLVKLHGQGYFSKIEGKDYHERKVNGQREKLADAIKNRKKKLTRVRRRVSDDD